MPIALAIPLLLVLLPLCTFAPGFFFVRRLRWNPLEKLCASVALSLVLLYLAAWTVYCVSPRGDDMPVLVLPCAAISALCALAAFLARAEIRRLVRFRTVGRAVCGFAFLLLWTIVLLAMIRHYSGARWIGDWLEHFQRSLYFLHRFPEDTPIIPSYALPARPPMMNVLAAFFLAQTADRFELFQLIFAFLNLLLFLPCCLLMPALGPRSRRRTVWLVALFAASPVIMQSVTYTWTKAGAAFYVILALWLYLAGWRKADRLRLTAAFFALSAGLLVHYSTAPYALLLAIHYLWVVFPRRAHKWRELAGIAASCSLLFATWIAWALSVYGVQTTLAANSPVDSEEQYSGISPRKVIPNLFDSIVPILARDPSLLDTFDQPSSAGALRDKAFISYQGNLVFGMGLVGGPLVLWLLFRVFLKSRRRLTPEQWFWLAMLAGWIFVGIAVVPDRDPLGVAQLTLLPVKVLGLTMLAGSVVLRRRLVVALVMAGCLVDFGLGVFLHARVESLENSAQTTVFAGPTFDGRALELRSSALSEWAWTNWFRKHQYKLTAEWLQDTPQQYGTQVYFRERWPAVAASLEEQHAEDARFWHGWYERHGGELSFLGDHVPGNIAAAILLFLFADLAAALLRRPAAPPL